MVGITHDHPKNPPRPINPSSDTEADDTSRATGSGRTTCQAIFQLPSLPPIT